MLVKELLKDVPYNMISDNGLWDVNIDNVSYNTFNIKENTLYLLIPGFSFNPYEKVDEIYATSKVKLFVTEKPLPGKPYVLVDNSKIAFSIICRNYFNIDFDKLLLFGVTGTNGKTTTNYLLENILLASNRKVVRIGTTEYKIIDKKVEANNTTPGIYEIFEMISEGFKNGARGICMEVSSHALDQNRVFGLKFDVAIFTNLTGDHLDYHKTMESYYEAKQKLFTKEYSKKAAINIDYEYGKRLFEETSIDKISYSTEKGDVYAKNTSFSLNGITTDIYFPSNKITITSPLVGRHNLENILAASSAAYVGGIGIDVIKEGIERLKNVPGRLEKFEKNGAYFFVDYAHTDDALKNVLSALLAFKQKRLIAVFGCGGDRDRTKRPRMAKVAETYADVVIVTSDNPRTEEPMAIINEIVTGFSSLDKVIVEVDRRAAIKKAVEMAKDGDIVLIAGKGHEDYQIIGKTKHHFDDREEVCKNIGVAFEKV